MGIISWFEKHNKLSFGITLLIALSIFYISSLTFGSGGSGTNTFSILYHILAFFFFAFFLLISLVRGKNKQFIFLAIIISIIYGFSDEIHQFFVPGRYTSLSDVFLDSVGVLFAFMIYLISIEYRTRNNK